jgi:catechol 2,3-dioxygenase-like lactoylglutathione lyase family enzyme
MKYKDAVPVIATADVPSTVDYYTRVLGFTEHFVYGDPPIYAGVERDGVLLYVAEDARLAAALKSCDLHPDVFIWVQNVDSVFEEHTRRGARIVEGIADRPWDARQYVIEDPNGYRLKVAEPVDARRPAV